MAEGDATSVKRLYADVVIQCNGGEFSKSSGTVTPPASKGIAGLCYGGPTSISGSAEESVYSATTITSTVV